MQPTDFLKDLTERLYSALPANLQTMKSDVEKNIHGILINTFSKLDLVTREEFDAQTKVLARTRKKVEELEARVKEMEESIQDLSGDKND